MEKGENVYVEVREQRGKERAEDFSICSSNSI